MHPLNECWVGTLHTHTVRPSVRSLETRFRRFLPRRGGCMLLMPSSTMKQSTQSSRCIFARPRLDGRFARGTSALRTSCGRPGLSVDRALPTKACGSIPRAANPLLHVRTLALQRGSEVFAHSAQVLQDLHTIELLGMLAREREWLTPPATLSWGHQLPDVKRR